MSRQIPSLTADEKTVLCYVALGNTAQDIAELLSKDVATITELAKSAAHKIHAYRGGTYRGIPPLARWAMNNNLLE